MKLGVQSLGWYVLRAADPLPLIHFYRDRLGLTELRGREYPPDQASAMLWAGGTTVFEPNRLTTGTLQPQKPASIEQCLFVPVFCSSRMGLTQERMGLKPEYIQDGTSYFRDPLGFFFGIESVIGSGALATPPNTRPLENKLVNLSKLEYRSPKPETTSTFFKQALGLMPLNEITPNVLNMGDGALLTILKGGDCPEVRVKDREEAVMVPVFRLYGYEHFVFKMKDMNVSCLQEVDLAGGRIWYGWDPCGVLFGFQERRPPDPGPEKWTTRLREDLLARQLWQNI